MILNEEKLLGNWISATLVAHVLIQIIFVDKPSLGKLNLQKAIEGINWAKSVVVGGWWMNDERDLRIINYNRPNTK